MQILVTAAADSATRALEVHPSHTAGEVAARYARDCGIQAELDQLRVVHGGHTIANGCTLDVAGVGPCATLELLPRLRGGGGDGGSTGAESRSAYLAMYQGKKPDKVDPEEERLARWTTCRLSGEPLHPPCVCDELGSVFNKDAVVRALVAKAVPASLSHISSLKHLVDVKLERAQGAAAGGAVQFACPVTGQPMGGKGRFVVVRRGGQGPGHVVAERALKEFPAVVEELVGGRWAPADLLPVNPRGEELQELAAALEARREAERAAKREKRASKAAEKRVAVAPAKPAGASAGGGSGGVLAPPALVADVAVAKKARTAAHLAPTHADKAVWNSLFTSGKQQACGKGTGDYMLRGGHRLL